MASDLNEIRFMLYNLVSQIGKMANRVACSYMPDMSNQPVPVCPFKFQTVRYMCMSDVENCIVEKSLLHNGNVCNNVHEYNNVDAYINVDTCGQLGACPMPLSIPVSTCNVYSSLYAYGQLRARPVPPWSLYVYV